MQFNFYFEPKHFTLPEAIEEMKGGSVYSFPCSEWTMIEGRIYHRSITQHNDEFVYDPVAEKFFYSHYTKWEEQLFNRAYYEQTSQRIKRDLMQVMEELKDEG